MMKKKSLILVLVAILGFPQTAFAQSLIKINTLLKNSDSIEITEDNLLLTQRGRGNKGNRRRRARKARRQVRRATNRAYRRGVRRAIRRDRRREFRDEVRDFRRRDTIRRVVGGAAAIGIGAAIAESNRNDERRTQTVIIDRGGSLQEKEYYGDLYQCQYLDRGGYYDANELEECLRKQF